MTVAGSAPSVSSINTSQALNTGARGGGANALPWILLALVVLIGAVAATVLVMRPKSNDSAAEAAPIGAAPNNPAPPPISALAPTPATQPSLPGAAAPAHSPGKHAANGDTHPEATPPAAPTSPAAPLPPAIVPDAPAATPTRKPAATAATLTCFSDPFSGQLRPTSVSHAAGMASFACKQDPFTGKYKKL
jgi:hypothetical protein